MQQGRQEGEAALLLRLLTRKFGPIDDEATRARVLAADAEQLLVWGERVLSAEPLLEVRCATMGCAGGSSRCGVKVMGGELLGRSC